MYKFMLPVCYAHLQLWLVRHATIRIQSVAISRYLSNNYEEIEKGRDTKINDSTQFSNDVETTTRC